jgi:hypothetical protein
MISFLDLNNLYGSIPSSIGNMAKLVQMYVRQVVQSNDSIP